MGHIKTFRQFLDATTKTVVVTFGRFNPPTIGHEKLLTAVADQAANSNYPAREYRIYVSQSVDEKKNPLKYHEKIKILRAMFPKFGRRIIEDESIKNILNAASQAYKDGFTRFVLVVGEDRVNEFSTLLAKYEMEKMANGGFYNFPDGIKVVSAGHRDADSDDVEGMSASKMRAAAAEGDFKTFSSGLPKGYEDGLALFNLLRKRMGLKETTNFRGHVNILTDPTDVREAYVRGEVFNVGDEVVHKNGATLKISKRGPNFLVMEDGRKCWLQDITRPCQTNK